MEAPAVGRGRSCPTTDSFIRVARNGRRSPPGVALRPEPAWIPDNIDLSHDKAISPSTRMPQPDHFPTAREIAQAILSQRWSPPPSVEAMRAARAAAFQWAAAAGVADKTRILDEIVETLRPDAPRTGGPRSGNEVLRQEIDYHGTGPYSGEYDPRDQWE